MGAGSGLRRRWQAIRQNPVIQLELRRIGRRSWWPGRRFFLFYPVLLGAAIGYGVMLAATRASLGVSLLTLVTGAPMACLASIVSALLSFALPWIVPALTAATIARERELGTLDLLRTTLLSERSIVLGKLASILLQLWPGILLLILLAPFQVIRVVGGAFFGLSGGAILLPLIGSTGLSMGMDLLLLVLLYAVSGVSRTLSDMVLHAALGLFVSARARTASAAIAISYGLVIALRVILWLLPLIGSYTLLWLLFSQPYPTEMMEGAFGYVWPAVLLLLALPLTIVLLEFAASGILLWRTVSCLRDA